MKKLKIVLLVVCLMVTALVCLVALSGCGEAQVPTAEASDPIELGAVSAESISYDGAKLVWDAVMYADSYEIVIGESTVNQSLTSYDLVKTESFSVAIRAISNKSTYLSNKTAATKSFEFVAPPTISMTDRSFTWNEIESAKGYFIRENETKYQGYQEKGNCSFELVKRKADENGINATLEVKPVFESPTLFSVYSAKKSAIILDAPTNLKYDGEILTWDAVENASKYIVETYRQDSEVLLKREEVQKPQYVFDSVGDNDGVGSDSQVVNESFECKITAVGDNDKHIFSSETAFISFTYVLPCQNLSISQGVLTWDSQVLADYYELHIVTSDDLVGTFVETLTNSYDGLESNVSYTITVMPKSRTGNIFSTWSPPLTAEILEAPVTTYDGEKIQWNKNDKATGYQCLVFRVLEGYANRINNITIPEGAAEHTIDYVTLEPGRYIYQVYALSSNSSRRESKPSEPITFIKLAQPSADHFATDVNYSESGDIRVYFNQVQVDLAADNLSKTQFTREDLGIYYIAGLGQSADENNSINLSQKYSDTDDVALAYTQEVSEMGGAKYKVLMGTKTNYHKLFNEEKRLVVFDNTVLIETLFERLAAPTTTLTGSLLTWDRVNKASGYSVKIVKIDGPEKVEDIFNIYDTRYDLAYLDAGLYRVYVAATGNGNLTISSVYSNASQVAKLPAPYEVKISDEEVDGQRLITWKWGDDGSKVTYGDGTSTHDFTPDAFTVHVGSEQLQPDGNKWSISSDMIATYGTAISVYAEGAADTDGDVTTLSSNASNSVENDEYALIAYRLHTPGSVMINDDTISWRSINGYDVDNVAGYNVYINDTRLINAAISSDYTIPVREDAVSNVIYFADYLDLNEINEQENWNVQIEAIGKGRFFNSNRTPSKAVTKLAAPTEVAISEFTGEITWKPVQSSESGVLTVNGYAIEIAYEKNTENNGTYYVSSSATSFSPIINAFSDEMVSVRICTVGDGGVYTISSNLVGVRKTKLEKLPTVAVDNNAVAVAVTNRSREITVTIDESLQGENVTAGNGYGIFIGGVEFPVRRYFEGENLYLSVEGEENLFEYEPAVGESVTYNSASKVYTYKFIAQSHGDFEVRIRALGGNYNTNPNQKEHSEEAPIIRYCDSDAVHLTNITLLESFMDSDIVRSNEGLLAEQQKTQTKVQLKSKAKAVKYEYTIVFLDHLNEQIGDAITDTVDDSGNAYTSISVTGLTNEMYKMKVTARALGNVDALIFDAASSYTKTLNLR